MNIFNKISCSHCNEEFRKSEIISGELCEGCFRYACLLFSIFNYGYQELLQMIDNSNDSDDICSKYESLFEFAQFELKPWYSYNCLPHITPKSIKIFQNKTNQKLFNQINASLYNLKSRMLSNDEKHLLLHGEDIASYNR